MPAQVSHTALHDIRDQYTSLVYNKRNFKINATVYSDKDSATMLRSGSRYT